MNPPLFLHRPSFGFPREVHDPVETSVEDGVISIRSDLPGVDPKDIEITLEKNVLTIVGVRRYAGANGKAESRSVRRYRVPEGVDADAVAARSENGVLEVKVALPKRPEPRRIPVVTETAPAVEARAA